MKQLVLKGKTDLTVYIFVPDSSSTVGAGLTGLVYNAAGLVASYVRPLGSRVAITLATQTVTGAHSDGGFVEVDATNMPGVYRLDLPDAVVASGVDSAVVQLKGATNMPPVTLELQLTAANLQDAVRAGLTALPNAAADAAGGLPISDAGGLDLDAVKTRVDLVPVPIWSGTLSAIAASSITFPGGYGINTQAQIVVELLTGTNAAGRSRYATYSGAGDVWTVDKAWNADSETTPSGTITARAFSVPAEPATNLPRVDVRQVSGTAQTAGDLAALVTTVDTVVDTVLADTNDLQTRVPAALVGGRMDASVGAMAANVMTAAAAASDLTTELQSGLATATSLATVASYIDTEIATIIANIAALNNLSAAQVRSELAVELARIDATVSSRLASASYTAPPSAAAIASAVHTTAMTEAYSADGGTVTVAQALYELLALASEFSVSGTTMTVKKRDGSTTALTLALDSASAPTAITRAS